ncbi:ectoderm-neural cortex protein 1-like isoform X1 [Prorops nasuta]|uniref:ectoderm-neural cortex protein 1-like isoform X1 n=1 Tax=Prorops nasuta TaxID=863751 RepID=UPI0034CEB03E
MSNDIVLIIKGNKYSVDKNKLAEKSKYFESMFTQGYKDSFKKEYKIKYDISQFTFETFMNWINDNSKEDRDIITTIGLEIYVLKQSLKEVSSNCPREFTNLLRLSVYFGVDELIEDIKHAINVFQPVNEIIGIFNVAKELCLDSIKDICYFICLERFQDIPVNDMIQLPEDIFTSLIDNSNLFCSEKHLNYLIVLWKDCVDKKFNFQLKSRMNVFPKLVNCILGFRCDTNDWALFAWDHKNLKEFPMTLKKIYSGMQIIGQGFSIYLVGGEESLGKGKFNNIIWRYCLVAKKWYNFARLPQPRRHMIAICVGDKLILVGGVGKHRIKLSSVDILDVSTGIWTKGSEVPEEFTDVPPNCVKDDILYIFKSEQIHEYNIQNNCWLSAPLKKYNNIQSYITGPMQLFPDDHSIYLFGFNAKGHPKFATIMKGEENESRKFKLYRPMRLTCMTSGLKYVPEIRTDHLLRICHILPGPDGEEYLHGDKSPVPWSEDDPYIPIYNEKYRSPVIINPHYLKYKGYVKLEPKIGVVDVIDPATLYTKLSDTK